MQQIQVRGEYITLGQLLKLAGEVATGGEVKEYLDAETPLVNGEKENRRGRKLRPGDVVEFKSVGRVELI